MESSTNLKPEDVSCSPSISTEPLLSIPTQTSSIVPSSIAAPLSPPPTPSPRTVPVSTVRLVVKPQARDLLFKLVVTLAYPQQ